MFIVWGKQKVERKIGYAADFCPVCRTVAQFQVKRVGMAGHVYFISLGQGELVGHIGNCQQCGTTIDVNAGAYKSCEKRAEQSIERLIENTFPNVRTTYAWRLEMEEKIQSRSVTLTPEERDKWLMEPFQIFTRQVEVRCGNIHLDRESGIGCLGTTLLAGVLFIVSMGIANPATQSKMLLVAGVVFVVGLIFTWIQLAREPGRFIRRRIASKLARALRPLNPTREELTACLAKLKAAGFRIGKKLPADTLWKMLQAETGVR